MQWESRWRLSQMVMSCDLEHATFCGSQPPHLDSKQDGPMYLLRYLPAFTFDESGFSSITDTGEAT